MVKGLCVEGGWGGGHRGPVQVGVTERSNPGLQKKEDGGILFLTRPGPVQRIHGVRVCMWDKPRVGWPGWRTCLGTCEVFSDMFGLELKVGRRPRKLKSPPAGMSLGDGGRDICGEALRAELWPWDTQIRKTLVQHSGEFCNDGAV